jgi:hypothetical protein
MQLLGGGNGCLLRCLMEILILDAGWDEEKGLCPIATCALVVLVHTKKEPGFFQGEILLKNIILNF